MRSGEISLPICRLIPTCVSGSRVLSSQGEPDDRFLWPLEPVASPNGGAVGCLMLLREPRFKGMVVLVKRRVGGAIPLRLDGCLTILIRAWPHTVILTD